MKLSNPAIHHLFKLGLLKAYEGDRRLTELSNVGPNSIDVRLHHELQVPTPSSVSEPLDPVNHEAESFECLRLRPGAGVIVKQGDFLRGSAIERFQVTEDSEALQRALALPFPVQVAPMYDGRSTIGRVGVASHVTAGFGDIGFGGAFTLEIFSVYPRPVILRPGMRIGQVFFDLCVGIPGYDFTFYEGSYSSGHNDGPVAPRLGAGRF